MGACCLPPVECRPNKHPPCPAPRLSWRAPTAGSDKLLSFKLMLTNAEGRSRVSWRGRVGLCTCRLCSAILLALHGLRIQRSTQPNAVQSTPCSTPHHPTQEAYEGPETMCEVTGLAANAQCVFAVKALYDDASFLWSQPVLVTTAKKSSGGGGGGKGGGGNGGAAPARGGK